MKTVIIGAGPAGVTVAETLRQNNYHEEILLFSSEPFPPYAPPAMIEYFMTGKESHLWRWKSITETLGIDYRHGTEVTEIIPENRAIQLTDGRRFNYDRLVIATGSRLFAPLPGADKPGIYNFKSLLAANKMIKEIHEGHAHNAVIVGAGFIGVEIALLLSNLGLRVTLLEMGDRIMSRTLDAESAEIALVLVRGYDVDVRLRTRVKGFLGDTRAEAVELESGETLKADILVAATGVRPNIEFLKGSGIQTNWGIPVDDHLQTNFPDIYAVGDVAETPSLLTGERFVHAIFPNAIAQGRLAAYNILGWDISYEGAENMHSLKHLGIPIIAAGRMEGEELCVRRDNILRKLYLSDNRIVGFQLVEDIKAAGIYRMLMNKKVDVKHIKDLLLDSNFGIGRILDQNLYYRMPNYIQSYSTN
jgi:NADPH-dependent 2,4-dienoyl-CoA reductase/sulfur reductase-like enzyme